MTTDDYADVRAHLATHDVPCPGCGYNLRGVPDPRCPECAMPLDLEIVTEGTVGQQEDRRPDPPDPMLAPARAPTRRELVLGGAMTLGMIALAIWIVRCGGSP